MNYLPAILKSTFYQDSLFIFSCHQTPLQLEDRWCHLLRFDEANAEDADGVFTSIGSVKVVDSDSDVTRLAWKKTSF